MTPCDFKEGNKTLYKPESMTDDECKPLLVFTDGKQCVSCWKPSFRERMTILFGGSAWLYVLSGVTQPPVYVTAENPFSEPKPCALKRWRVNIVEFIKDVFKHRKGAENG